MIPRPTAEQPDELRKWLLAAGAGPMPFAALEAKRRQQTATPDELLAIALHRFRRFSRDPDAKLRVTLYRMGRYTVRHVIAATPHRTVRANTMANAIRAAALSNWSPAPDYLRHILDTSYTRRKEPKQ